MCQECREEKANVFFTKIVNGVKTEVHLCEKCAREKGDLEFTFEPKFSLQNFFASFLSEPLSEIWSAPQREQHPSKVQCSNCSLTFTQFSQIGRFGCSSCYSSFGEDKLQPLFRRIHGSINHNGKVPRRLGGTTRIKREIEKLRQQLQQHIQMEEYEKAAITRDKIKSLEKELDELDEPDEVDETDEPDEKEG